MEDLDCVVVGAGVVGLAVARRLALSGRQVVVLEAENTVGLHTSSRNSEVIHAGIYYPPGSLKARLCVEGWRALYDYCASHGVPHRPIGKVLVAVRAEEISALHRYKDCAEANGVTDLRWVDRLEMASLEPAVVCTEGLLSPSTGIVDSHSLMGALRADAEDHGAILVFSSPVLGGAVGDDGIDLEVGGAEPTRVRCRTLVNAAGLWAPSVARSLSGHDPRSIPGQYFARGHYFVLAGRSPFKRLVYPMPVPGGLGVHVTLDLGGQVRFGPDVSWIDRVDYTFDERRAASFYPAIRAYFPALPDGALDAGYVGIRPKTTPEGEAAGDFILQGPEAHGVAGLVHLFGIESPGLTACLAIADEVARLVGG